MIISLFSFRFLELLLFCLVQTFAWWLENYFSGPVALMVVFVVDDAELSWCDALYEVVGLEEVGAVGGLLDVSLVTVRRVTYLERHA